MVNVEEEVWLPVLGHEEAYEVSSLGNVRSLDRLILRIDGSHQPFKGKPKKLNLVPHGYLRVTMRGVQCWVHCLVAEAFHGPRPEGLHVRHLNGVRTDNRAENLRWGTRSENMLDRVTHGTHNHAVKEYCPRNHALAFPNLVASEAAGGKRNCKSCHRARTKVRYWAGRGVHLDIQAESDEQFARLMKLPEARESSPVSPSTLLRVDEISERDARMKPTAALALIQAFATSNQDSHLAAAAVAVLAEMQRLNVELDLLRRTERSA